MTSETRNRNNSVNTNAGDDTFAASPVDDDGVTQGNLADTIKRTQSQPIKYDRKTMQEMWKPKEDLPKFTDSKLNAPMVAIVRTESLKSF